MTTCVYCNVSTKLLCDGCYAVGYCCHDCQRKHWHTHAPVCQHDGVCKYSDLYHDLNIENLVKSATSNSTVVILHPETASELGVKNPVFYLPTRFKSSAELANAVWTRDSSCVVSAEIAGEKGVAFLCKDGYKESLFRIQDLLIDRANMPVVFRAESIDVDARVSQITQWSLSSEEIDREIVADPVTRMVLSRTTETPSLVQMYEDQMLHDGELPIEAVLPSDLQRSELGWKNAEMRIKTALSAMKKNVSAFNTIVVRSDADLEVNGGLEGTLMFLKKPLQTLTREDTQPAVDFVEGLMSVDFSKNLQKLVRFSNMGRRGYQFLFYDSQKYHKLVSIYGPERGRNLAIVVVESVRTPNSPWTYAGQDDGKLVLEQNGSRQTIPKAKVFIDTKFRPVSLGKVTFDAAITSVYKEEVDELAFATVDALPKDAFPWNRNSGWNYARSAIESTKKDQDKKNKGKSKTEIDIAKFDDMHNVLVVRMDADIAVNGGVASSFLRFAKADQGEKPIGTLTASDKTPAVDFAERVMYSTHHQQRARFVISTEKLVDQQFATPLAHFLYYDDNDDTYYQVVTTYAPSASRNFGIVVIQRYSEPVLTPWRFSKKRRDSSDVVFEKIRKALEPAKKTDTLIVKKYRIYADTKFGPSYFDRYGLVEEEEEEEISIEHCALFEFPDCEAAFVGGVLPSELNRKEWSKAEKEIKVALKNTQKLRKTIPVVVLVRSDLEISQDTQKEAFHSRVIPGIGHYDTITSHSLLPALRFATDITTRSPANAAFIDQPKTPNFNWAYVESFAGETKIFYEIRAIYRPIKGERDVTVVTMARRVPDQDSVYGVITHSVIDDWILGWKSWDKAAELQKRVPMSNLLVSTQFGDVAFDPITFDAAGRIVMAHTSQKRPTEAHPNTFLLLSDNALVRDDIVPLYYSYDAYAPYPTVDNSNVDMFAKITRDILKISPDLFLAVRLKEGKARTNRFRIVFHSKFERQVYTYHRVESYYPETKLTAIYLKPQELAADDEYYGISLKLDAKEAQLLRDSPATDMKIFGFVVLSDPFRKFITPIVPKMPSIPDKKRMEEYRHLLSLTTAKVQLGDFDIETPLGWINLNT